MKRWIRAVLASSAALAAAAATRATQARPESEVRSSSSQARAADGPLGRRLDRASELALASGVDAARAQQRVRELVELGPRMGGTRSGDAAAEYVARAFAAAGLDVRTVDDPPREAYQALGWKVRAWRADDEGGAIALDRAWPWVHSADGSGTVDLALESAPGVAWLTAKRARGESQAALVLVDGACNIDGEHPVVGALRPGAAQPCVGVSKREGAQLREWLASGARVRVEFEVRGERRLAPPRTVLARLRGANSPAGEGAAWAERYFLFCAHGDSDSGGPGADDNASGVATLLEIAAAWSAAVKSGAATAPACEVRFAVWGSEIHSTRDYLEQRIPSEGECLGVLNYDQAGFGSGADQLNVEPDDVPANLSLVASLLEVLRDHAPAKAEAPGDFPSRWATNRSLGGTDSYVFSKAKYFVDGARPSLTLFTSAWGAPAEHKRTQGMRGESWREREQVAVDYDAYYHSAGDTPANTTDKEPWNMAWCARVGMLGVARHLDALASRKEADK